MAMVVAASCMGQHMKFFCVFQTLGLLSAGNPGDPAQRGSHAPPPPTEKIRTPIFLQFGACPDFFLSGTPSEPAAGSVSRKFWVAPLAKKSGHHSLHSFEACPDLFFRKPQRECVPKISGGGSRGVRGFRCSPGLFLLVSSNTPFILLRFFPCYGRRLDIEMHQMFKTDKL